MKRFHLVLIVGLVTGLFLASTTFAFAADQIKLIVNGKEIQCDVPPQVIDGRTMVPARFLAEALGAKVEWDEARNAVNIITNQSVAPAQPEAAQVSSGDEINVKAADGALLYTVKINSIKKMSERNQFSDKTPAQVVDINYTYKNIANAEDIFISDMYFKVYDQKGVVGYTYPNMPKNFPQKIAAGATCTADMIFGLDNASDTLKVAFYKNMFDDKALMTFNLPIN